MEFNFINILSLIIVIIMLIPSIITLIKSRKNKRNKLNIKRIVELFFKYLSVILMVLPLGIHEFGFKNVPLFFVYLIGNIILLFIYLVMYYKYMKNKTNKNESYVAILPIFIFILSGMCLGHFFLTATGILYGVLHLDIIYNKKN